MQRHLTYSPKSIVQSLPLIFDKSVEPIKSVHGVVVTHLLAKEKLRVRFSLDALRIVGESAFSENAGRGKSECVMAFRLQENR